MSDDSGFQVPPELRSLTPDDWFAHMFPGALSFFGEPTPLDQIPQALGGTRPAGQFSLTRDTEPSPLDALLIDKRSAIIEVPVDYLMSIGAIPDTRVPNKPYKAPLRWRARQHVRDLRERIACWAYQVISGQELPESEDY